MRNLIYGTLFFGLMLLGGCQDLSVNNENEPDRDRALAEPGDLVSLIQGSTVTSLNAVVDLWGVHMAGLSDQLTTTNKYLSFWDFTDEPRIRLNNRTTYTASDVFSQTWLSFNGAISSANTVLGIIEVEGASVILNDGTDVTIKLASGAYFVRGLSRGYLSMIYDQGYLVGPETDLATIEAVPYAEVSASAVSDLENSLALAEQIGAGFVWDLLIGGSTYDLIEFREIVHSLIAKIMISEARTQAEAASWPASRWDQILSHAEQGLGAALPAFSPASVGELFYSTYADWNSGVYNGGGYLPTDMKISHLLDPSMPVRYPTDTNIVLAPMESDDPRVAYYAYSTKFAFLRAERRRALFSNYSNLRMWAQNNWYSMSGAPVPIMTSSEIQYIKAEANLWKGNMGGVAAALNASPRGSVPTRLEISLPSVSLGIMAAAGVDFGGNDGLAAGKVMTGGESREVMVRALHTEYSVELDMLGGIGLQWFFMRRHDLLQTGTAVHYAIPGGELEITGKGYYTFGGPEAAGQPGTANGSNDWTTFDARNGLSGVGASKTSERRYRAVDGDRLSLGGEDLGLSVRDRAMHL